MVKSISALLVATGIVGAAAAADHWSASLQPVNGSTVSGTASVDLLGADSSKVTISVRGAAANTSLRWHIHTGGCPSPGGVFGPESAYPALTTVAGGTAQATAVLPMKPPTGGSYAVQVHSSAGAPPRMEDAKPNPASDAVACGDLKEVMNKVPEGN